MTAGNQVRVTVQVAVPPALAFEVFTQEIDLWWRRGPRWRQLGGERAIIAIEPQTGGRVFETLGEDGPVHVIGHVLAWQPPARLLLEWRLSNFAPGERTEVEVLFEPGAAGGTTVTVVHSGWAEIRADHPARHGEASAAFLRRLGLWWGDLLGSYRLSAATIAERHNKGP